MSTFFQKADAFSGFIKNLFFGSVEAPEEPSTAYDIPMIPLDMTMPSNGYSSKNNGAPPSSYDVPLIENGKISFVK